MTEQKRTDLDWQDVRVFVALARQGSLSATARMLSVNHATVARRVQSLEQALGEKLVERRPEGYVLTAAGTQALMAASDMEQAAQTLRRGVADGSPSGLVRISSSPGLSAGFLASRLAPLALRYPQLDIDLAHTLRSVSLERHEADIAIRVDKPKDGDIVARPLATMGYAFYGTEETCRSVEAGGEPVLIGFNEADGYITQAAWMSQRFPRARVAFRAKDQFLQSIAAQAGVGLALIPHYIGRSTPLLRICDLGSVPAARDVYLLTRSRDRKDASIRVIADEIVSMFEQARDLFR
ncbi:MAG: LysR family transcriptional regulator [Luteibacter sp.]|uniref:LysR family transcriptional regulator n=1 Tax=unclassified Luteibacter TaxID=2620188 RepID=UPI0005BB5CAD|nr:MULTISPECIES: LysR family transcriptional regulator [unclassified Luteibacter]MDQ7994267.1 LysR family transcriptional regulator [Luteibacter sp.]MDQ8048567.1 LysR family transcriptional regulator [Luteibacter sp.]MDR6642239.1 molybdate transport repressor ModE-like protein [Luteibacter sp. 1214]